MTIAECNMPAARNIDRIIQGKGLKQVYVAEQMGYAPQAISDMLNGRKLMSAYDIMRFSAVLGVSMEEIFKTKPEAFRRK